MIALLQKNSLTVKDFFKAEKFQLTLSERQSSAVITVGPEAPAIGVSDWLRDETEPGAGIVWRVKSVATDYATDTRTITCEHMVAALKDMIMFGEVKPGMMSGNTKDKNCTAYQAVRYILNRASDWTAGTVGYSKSAPYNFNGDDLYSALETVTSSLMDAWWSYDFTAYPFKLSIKPKSTDVQCEMRMDRNIQSLKKTIDRTRMFTRFYPIGSKDLHISGGGYVEKNANLYGVVCKTETDQTKKTEAELTAWANERLNNHAEPIVTVTVSGIDMSEATGEALDKLTLGTVCRMPLPEYGTTLTERITQLSWSDKIADPESVSITLANQVEDVASIVNQLAKSAGGGGRAAAKDAKEDHAWLVDTEEKAGMLAEAVAGPGADKDWSRVSSIFADGTGLHAKVTYAENEIVTHQTRLDQNERSIGMVVEVRNGKELIKAGEICLAINDAKESTATINAKKIYLLGKTIADTISAEYISAKIASIPTLTGIAASFTGNVSSNSSVIAPYVYLGVGGPELGSGIQYVQISGPTNNVYKLQYKTYRNTSWQDAGSFSRAVASWDQGWSSGTFTYKAQPQGQSGTTQIYQGTSSWSGRTVTIPIKATNSNNPGSEVATGYSCTATYTMAKSDISMTRSGRSGSQPSTDAALTNLYVTQNGWYTFTVTAAGTSKTFRMQITVPEA